MEDDYHSESIPKILRLTCPNQRLGGGYIGLKLATQSKVNQGRGGAGGMGGIAGGLETGRVFGGP